MKYKGILAAFISGILLSLSYPPISLGFVAWFFFVPILDPTPPKNWDSTHGVVAWLYPSVFPIPLKDTVLTLEADINFMPKQLGDVEKTESDCSIFRRYRFNLRVMYYKGQFGIYPNKAAIYIAGCGAWLLLTKAV